MKKVLFIYILFLLTFSISAQEGSSVYNFLNFPGSARVSALGGTNVSVIDNDLSLVFQNPAFLGPEMDMTLAVNYMSYIADVGTGNIAFAKAIGEKSSWGVGFNYINYGKIKQTTAENIIEGNLSPKDIGANAFFSRDLTDKIRGGVTAKFIYSDFGPYTSLGLAVDLGLSYYDRDNDFSVGLVGKNLGRQIKAYEDVIKELPWDIQLGFTKRLSLAPIRFSATARYLNKWNFYNLEGEKDNFGKSLIKHLVLGVEFIPSENFWLALGFNPKTSADMEITDGNKLGGFSIGAGVRVKAFHVGCAVGKYYPSATSFLFSINTSLSELKL